MADEDVKAVVVTAHGGPEVLEVQARPVPVPGPTQALRWPLIPGRPGFSESLPSGEAGDPPDLPSW